MVRKDIDSFINTIPKGIIVVAATKYIGSNDMRVLYGHGIKDFGENRVDSFLAKYEELSDLKDIKWHFIGHLQRNKAKKVINKIHYLHSLDSLDLAKEIEKYRESPLDVFIEVSINLEESKNGVPFYKVEDFIKELQNYKKIHLIGLMMMAYKDSDKPEQEFLKLKSLKEEIEKKLKINIPYLSMGMSDDYEDALKAGATHIRLGRILYEK